MNSKPDPEQLQQGDAEPRKSYRQPVLSELGRLEDLTQGTGPLTSDADALSGSKNTL